MIFHFKEKAVELSLGIKFKKNLLKKIYELFLEI